jgi:hypothetical protein
MEDKRCGGVGSVLDERSEGLDCHAGVGSCGVMGLRQRVSSVQKALFWRRGFCEIVQILE